MNYFEEDICERIELAIGRLSDIEEEDLNLQGCVHLDELKDYFKKVSDFILYVYDVYNIINTSNLLSLEYLKRINNELYKDILPGNYEKSFANPDYAVDKLGEDYGKLLSFLYVEVRSIIAYIYEGKMLNFITTVELFIEIYSMFCDEEAPKSKYIKEAIYYHMYDYVDVLVAERTLETISPEYTFATDIIMKSDLSDIRYLYLYGEYIGDRKSVV